MNPTRNKGFDEAVISEYQAKMQLTGRHYLEVDPEDNSEEHVHIYFVGQYENCPVLFDAVIYTLRLHHESELFEIAEHKAARHFPEYKKITYQEDENGNLRTLDSLEEEIGLFIAEAMMEMEEEGEIKVKEHIEVDANLDFGVGLDVGLHVQAITPTVIEKFIEAYNSGELVLDANYYTFQNNSEEAS